MNIDLTNKTAIVTGGSKGYGKGIAQALKQKGVNVWITDIDEKALEATAKEIGVKTIKADVCKSEDWDNVFKQVLKDSGGKIDILVNNAGSGLRRALVEEHTDELIERSIAINLTGAMFGCRRAAKIMRQQNSGTIINIASVCAKYAWPGWGVYSAAKAGVAMFY